MRDKGVRRRCGFGKFAGVRARVLGWGGFL